MSTILRTKMLFFEVSLSFIWKFHHCWGWHYPIYITGISHFRPYKMTSLSVINLYMYSRHSLEEGLVQDVWGTHPAGQGQQHRLTKQLPRRHLVSRGTLVGPSEIISHSQWKCRWNSLLHLRKWWHQNHDMYMYHFLLNSVCKINTASGIPVFYEFS